LRAAWDTILPCTQRGIYSDVTVSFDMADFSLIQGQHLFVMDGTSVVRTVPITAETITITDLPIGAYFLDVPVISGLVSEYNMIFVRSGSVNETVVRYASATAGVLGAAQVHLFGGNDVLFSVVALDAGRSVVQVITYPVRPHWVDSLPTVYASVTVDGTLVRSYHPTETNA
jgi:hypothetical protein